MKSLVWILAGALILARAWLSQVFGQWGLLITFLVSAYWVVSGITGHCPVKKFFRKQLGEAGNDEEEE